MTTACDPYRCGTDWRFADFEGRLGDSVVASVPDSPRVPGRMFHSMGQWRGNQNDHQIALGVNFWGFADSVRTVHLRLASEGSRDPLVTFEARHGYAVRDTFFNLYPQLVSQTVADRLRNGFLQGQGLVEIRGYQLGENAAARMSVVQRSEYAPGCS